MNDFERIPPQNIEAEVCVLGSMILDPTCIPDVRVKLKPEDFYRLAHQSLFWALCGMSDRREAIDLVTLRAHLEKGAVLDEVGGVDYLVSLVEGVPAAYNAVRYAEMVLEKAKLRALMALGAQLHDQASCPQVELDRLLGTAQQTVYEISTRDQKADGRCMSAGQAAEALLNQSLQAEKAGVSPGLMTGLGAFDRATVGIQPTDYVLLGGVTGSGKTTLALTYLAARVAEAGGGVVYVSVEMWPPALSSRVVQSRCGFLRSQILAGTLSTAEWKEYKRWTEEQNRWKLQYVCGTPTVAEIAARAMGHASRWGRLDLIVVDYLQRLAGPESDLRKRITGITHALKDLTVDLHVPVVALSQFPREVAKDERKPGLFDFKESGDLENDADLALLMHVPPEGQCGPKEFTPEWTDDPRARWHEVWLRLAKARSGVTTPWYDDAGADDKQDAIRLKFYPHVTRMEPWQ